MIVTAFRMVGYPLRDDMPALMISSTNNKLLAITVLKEEKAVKNPQY